MRTDFIASAMQVVLERSIIINKPVNYPYLIIIYLLNTIFSYIYVL